MHRIALTSALSLLSGLALAAPTFTQDYEIPHQKFVLDNGLEVIVHEDHSDPVVAVYVYYHVGSGREEVGRSGFAHLFEHLMFQGSQHVGDDQHFKLIQEAGGTLNGTTNTDRTNYYETLPANQLELALWLESDRMGFLLPSVTQEKLDNQREVVKNERRQRYENRPYGLVSEATARALYPADHPYSWTTIGSMEDLGAASLEDVLSFFQRWYGPNNATLAIGGDVDTQETLALVEKYFGSIPRGPAVAKPEPRPTTLTENKRVILEDKVQLPQLSYTWPTVEMDHADEPALNLLASVLSASKSAVLDKALTIDEQLASYVTAYNWSSELAGTMGVTLRPQPGVTLDQLEAKLHELLAQVADEGVEESVLDRHKTVRKASIVRGLETVASRTSQLGIDNLFRGEPDYVAKDLARHEAVTPADVVRVLKQYVLDRPAVIVSVVPEGQVELAAMGRSATDLEAELALDRTQQPSPSAKGEFTIPTIWHSQLANGVEVIGTPYDEIPLTQFSLSVPAGRLRENMSNLGLSSLTADLLDEGTGRYSSTELLDALDALGARLRISSSDDEITISVSALNEYLAETVELVEEIVLTPRFSEQDFARIQKERLTDLSVRSDNIGSIASDAWGAISFGVGTVAGSPSEGTEKTIAALTRDDVAAFWATYGTPVGARLDFVGELDARGVEELFANLTERWKADDAHAVEASHTTAERIWPEETTIYLVDKPGAAQSEIRIGHPGVSSLDPNYFGLQILNYVLGGSFSSRINLNLREDKGYTYGARSSFYGGLRPGPFVASSAVRTDVTAESVIEFMSELEGIQDGVTEQELEFTKNAMLQAMERSFESTRALARHLDQIGKYHYADDYVLERREQLQSITQDELTQLAREFVKPDRMAILVVGDRETILEGLEALPYDLVELDAQGRPIDG